jgi:hypothetical protein
VPQGEASNMSAQNIRPIQTQYRGFRFRSRAEARWAVFFDTLEIRWQYELEGFDLGIAGWYLPDFWLPGYRCWLEIKRGDVPPTDVVISKTRSLCEVRGCP